MIVSRFNSTNYSMPTKLRMCKDRMSVRGTYLSSTFLTKNEKEKDIEIRSSFKETVKSRSLK